MLKVVGGLGVDVEQPREQQADFAWLRSARKLGWLVLTAALGAAITGSIWIPKFLP